MLGFEKTETETLNRLSFKILKPIVALKVIAEKELIQVEMLNL